MGVYLATDATWTVDIECSSRYDCSFFGSVCWNYSWCDNNTLDLVQIDPASVIDILKRCFDAICEVISSPTEKALSYLNWSKRFRFSAIHLESFYCDWKLKCASSNSLTSVQINLILRICKVNSSTGSYMKVFNESKSRIALLSWFICKRMNLQEIFEFLLELRCDSELGPVDNNVHVE